MEKLLLDLRLALRRLRQNPGFSVVAILTLALGIGANTAIFSMINVIVLRPLPVANPSELVSVNETLGGNTFPTLSYPNYRDVRDRNNVLAGLIAYRILPSALGLPGSSQRLWGYLVTGNYFDVLGIKPAIGRLISPSDDRTPGGHPVAVISYGTWQKRFGGDPSVVGRVVKFNSMDFTVLVVTPRGFFGTELYYTPEVFFPMMEQKQLEGGGGYLENRDTSNTFIAGRLKTGVTMSQAESALNSIAHQLADEYPKNNAGMKLLLTPPGLAGNYIRGAVIGFAAVLFGVSCLVLLVACTNLASMLLARASDRRKETAIRLAIGAGRGRLVRQLLTESLVVAIAGGAGGALLVVWITDALSSWRPAAIDFPLLLNLTPDFRVFLFALLASVVTTFLFGLLPALQSTKTDLVPWLKNEASAERSRRWHLRDYVVASQVCLSVLLLVCSVLVVRSFQRAVHAPVGYNPEGVVTAAFDLNTQGYNETRGRAFERQLLEKVRSVPTIESAALVDWLPLSLNFSQDSIFVEGQPRPKATDAPTAYAYTISPDYFRTMRTRILEGRQFDARDKEGGKRVAVVNQAFVQQLLHGGSPIGRRFSTGGDRPPIEIVGVAQNGKYVSLTESPRPAYWVPLDIWYSSNAALIARSRLNSADALQVLRNAVRDLDPTIALYATGTLTQQLDLPLFPARMAAGALGAFGLLALILAATGIYGVMAYAVARRTREIGIRMAIGASQSQVLGLMGRRALMLIGSGTAVGLGLALVVARLLQQILYGVEPTDPITYATVFLLILTIAAVACLVPAVRAVRINPVSALRQE
jgi:predicted permease